MALTPFQRKICRIIADHRIATGESYVAVGSALNEILAAPRVSRDVDLFHDTDEALDSTWRTDRELLARNGLTVEPVRERPSFVEAEVRSGGETVLLQWVRDSAFRFFPLIEHPAFGLALHPFDLATNKVLALVGRLEARDWIDTIECSERLQPLGYLAWAACGKDPGFGPLTILQEAARSGRYSADEIASLSFTGTPPDAADLSRRWHLALATAKDLVDLLPVDHSGECVLDAGGSLFRGGAAELEPALSAGAVIFHPGSIRGALPRIVEA
jgi:hypothetical protein